MLLHPSFHRIVKRTNNPEKYVTRMKRLDEPWVSLLKTHFEGAWAQASKSLRRDSGSERELLTQPKPCVEMCQLFRKGKYVSSGCAGSPLCVPRVRPSKSAALRPSYITTHRPQQPAFSSFSLMSILWPGGYDPMVGAPPLGDDISLLYRRISRTKS